eukprot:scaffold39150_cov58-Phaeocystis_antarctica.AAC.3
MSKPSRRSLRPAGAPEASCSARSRPRLPQAPASLGQPAAVGGAGIQIALEKKYNEQLDVDGSIQANVEGVGAAALLPLSKLEYCNRTYGDGVCHRGPKPRTSRLADRAPGRSCSATHTVEPWLGQHVYDCIYPELATGVLAKAGVGVEGSLLIGTRLSSTVQHRDARCADAYHCAAWVPEPGTAAYDGAKVTAFVGD